MCLGIYVCCVLVVLCLSLGCVFCFLWCVACCWMCFVSMSCVLVSYVAGLVWGCVSACGVLVVGLFGVRASLGCSVYVSGLLIVWCVLLYWVFCVLYVWRGVSIGLLCLVFWLLVFACVVVVGFGVWACVVFGFWLGFVFWLVAGVLFFVGRWCAGLVGGLFLLVVWVVFVCWGWVVASYFFGAILFVLIVVGLSGFLLASAFCLVLQPVF